MKKENRGGARPGAGAKPKADPTIQITIRVPKSIVDKAGGYLSVKIKAQEFLCSS